MKLRAFWAAASSWARYDIWNVAVATLERPIQTIDDLRRLSNIRWMPPQPPLYFLADPFPYRHDGRDWLLVERGSHHARVHACICRVDPTPVASGFSRTSAPVNAAAPEPVIDRGRHMSYPFTFTDRDVVYCAPEIGQEEGCVIYRLGVDGVWTPWHHILRGQRIVDPTFFQHGGRWWLFYTEPPPAHVHVLNACFADTLAGPWTPHPLNPLKLDATSARPAGPLLTIGGRVYRPAQDCSRTYGGAVNIMEITELTPAAFRETHALRLEPDASWPYPDGLHHLVVDGTRVYFDAKKTRYDVLLWLKTRRALTPRVQR